MRTCRWPRVLLAVGAVLAAGFFVSLLVVGRPQVRGQTPPLSEDEAALLVLINDYRLEHGLSTLKVSPTLSAAARWMSEDVLRRYFRFLKLKKIPDAAMIEGERLTRVVEFVGRDYTTPYLRRFHQHWTKKQIPYQIW